MIEEMAGITYVEQVTDDDCLAACVASILDFPPGVLPHPYMGEGPGWEERWRRGMRQFGLEFEFISGPVEEPHIVAVSIPGSTFAHAVVMEGERLIWDPAPGGLCVTSISGLDIHWRMTVWRKT